MIRSASQCPGTAPSSPLGRAQTGGWRPGIRLLAPGLGQSGRRGAGDAAGASGAQGLFHPQLGAQAAGALDVQGLVDLLVTDAHAPIIGVLEPQAGGDLPGTGPDPPGGSTTRSRRAGLASSLRILGRAKGARAAACAAAGR